MPHLEALKINSCGKHCEKRRNYLEQAISPFPTLFSTLVFHFGNIENLQKVTQFPISHWDVALL